MLLKSDGKFEETLSSGLENDIRNLANFHQSTHYHDYIFIDRAPYKQLHGILQISVQISMFSPHMQKVAFSA